MHTTYIGMGANLPSCTGSPEATLAVAMKRLTRAGRLIARSSLYSTAPVGFSKQPRFINAVTALETKLSARALLDSLLELEREFGRDRSNAVLNGPRTLDLDILLFGDCIIDEPLLHIPHPRLAERAFALVPLNEIAPEAVEPRSGLTVAELLRRLRDTSANDAVIRIDSELWRTAQERSDADK